jgi:hypothetical protein
VIAAWVAFVTAAADESRHLLVALLVTVWGLRLGGYLAWRNIGKGEDPRYQAMRRHWGQRFWWVSLFTVFLLQGALMWIISLPIQVAMASATVDTFWAAIAVGVALWAVGLFFETVGDRDGLGRLEADVSGHCLDPERRFSRALAGGTSELVDDIARHGLQLDLEGAARRDTEGDVARQSAHSQVGAFERSDGDVAGGSGPVDPSCHSLEQDIAGGSFHPGVPEHLPYADIARRHGHFEIAANLVDVDVARGRFHLDAAGDETGPDIAGSDSHTEIGEVDVDDHVGRRHRNGGARRHGQCH